MTIRCDNGPEFISHEFTTWEKLEDIRIDYIKMPISSVLTERFDRVWSVNTCLTHWKKPKAMQPSGYGFTITNDHTKPMVASRH